MQDHHYDKTQPENVAFLQRLRGLLDEYGGRATVGEVGDGARSLKTVAAYTSGGDKLHMCYTFDLLGPELSARHVRRCVENFQAIVTDGWVCWAFSNHDVMRHVSRFALREADRERVAKLAISLLASLRGTICLYQGEELGLPEAELTYEELRDPYGIRFWPAFKGRDGCRTPMVWERDEANAGFSSGYPWLPVRDDHRVLAVNAQEGVAGSVLEHYRRTLAFRRAHAALLDGDMSFLATNQDVLAFTRKKGSETLLFVFNLTGEPQTVQLAADMVVAEALPMPGFGATISNGGIRLDALDLFCGRMASNLSNRTSR
ncbi:glycosidase [Sinorhizobium fredii]